MGNRLAASQKQEYRQKGPNIEKLVFQFLQIMQVGHTLTIRQNLENNSNEQTQLLSL